MNIWEIINEIAPLYNEYKNNKDTIRGTDAVWIMREIWEILEKYIEESGIAPHSLYREIYWKWEWTTNVAQKSYITREFQWRCYRIKKMFKKKEDIEKDLPTLVSFTAFREAMPFFDNPKYKLSWNDREILLNILNKSPSKKKAMEEIEKLQSKYIWIKNDRKQKQWEVDIDLFRNFYSYLKEILENDYETIKWKLIEENISTELLRDLSKNMMSMTDDSFKMKTMDYDNINSSIRNWVLEFTNNVAKETTPKLRRRVRKVVTARGLLQLSRMLTAMTSEEYLRNYKNTL